MMLHTTFRFMKATHAAWPDHDKIIKALGDPDDYGLDRPIPLDEVLKHGSLSAAIWCLRMSSRARRPVANGSRDCSPATSPSESADL